MALRRKALSYGDEASQYDFESFKEYKKGERGGLKGAGTGASTGASIGGTIGSFIPGVGTAIGTGVGAVVGGTAGAIAGNRKMKREYLKYAQEMTAKGMAKKDAESLAAQQEAAYNKAMAEQRAAEVERQRALYGTTTTQPIVGGELPMYKKGGAANMVMINVEKGELAVDPRTMKVIMDFNDVPKHPKGKDVINQKGNVKVPVGTIIIPADMRKDFLKAKPEQRIEIAAELIERQREGEEKEMEENEMEGEEMPMQQGMAQEQMPQGQGMMAMMSGEGEGMEKMGMGGYIKKYEQAGIVLDDELTKEQIDALKGYQYGITFKTDPKYKDIAKAMRADPNVDKYLKDIGSRASNNFGLSDDELIAAFTQSGFDLSKFKSPQTTTPSTTITQTTKSASTQPTTDNQQTEALSDILEYRQRNKEKEAANKNKVAGSGAGLSGYAFAQGIGMLGAAIPQYFAGREQEKEAKKALDALQSQPMARYKPTAELEQTKLDVAAARERAKYGFSTEDVAAWNQRRMQQERTAYQRARESGLSGAGQAVLGALGSQRLQALNEMAIQDSRLKLEKIKDAEMGAKNIAQQYQALANQQAAQDIRYRTMQEQAYGGALRAGLENQYGAFSTAGAGLGYAAGSGLSSLLGLIG